MSLSKSSILAKLDAARPPEEGKPEAETVETEAAEVEDQQEVLATDEGPQEETVEETEAEGVDPGPLLIAELAEAQGMDLETFLDSVQGSVTVDGQSETKSLREILRDYQTAKSSTHRYTEAQRLADEARAQAQQGQALVQEKVQQLDAKLAEAQAYASGEEQQLKTEYSAVNWAELERDEPERYAALRIKFLERAQTLRGRQQQLAAERQRIMEDQQQQWEAQKAEHVATQRRLLLESVPEWNDPKTFETESAGITEYLTGLGATQQDIADVGQSSAWLLRAIREGYIHAKAPKVPKRVQKVLKVAKPGQGDEPGERETRERSEALNKLHSTRGQRRNARDPAVLAAAKAIGVGVRR